MRDLAVHTRKSPMQRANELCKFIKYLNGTAPEMEQLGMNREETVNYMGKWGLKIGTDQDRNNPELFDMKGRLLDPEPLIMRNPAQYDENGKGQYKSRASLYLIGVLTSSMWTHTSWIRPVKSFIR